jgi:hypothetical protein
VYRLLDFLDRILEETGGLFYGPSSHTSPGRWPGAGMTVLCIILIALAAGLAWFGQRWSEAFCLMSLGLGAYVTAVFCNHM